MHRLVILWFIVYMTASFSSRALAQANAAIDVEVKATLIQPPTSCSVATSTPSTDLEFGTIAPPSSGNDQWVDVDEVDGTVSTSPNIADPTDHMVGGISIQALNSNSLTVSVTFPSDLDNAAGPSYTKLSYTGAWAVSSTSTSGYTTISGTSDTQSSLGGVGGSATRYYRFGGEVSDIGDTTPEDTYDGTIDLSISCSL